MKVIVSDRQSGKTTKLIEWLLDGKVQASYPKWSRVIVCVSAPMVIECGNALQRHIQDMKTKEAFLCSRSDTHLGTECLKIHRSTRASIVKNVWGLKDLAMNVRRGAFEYVVDDFDLLIERQMGLQRMPTAITLTGEAVDGLRD